MTSIESETCRICKKTVPVENIFQIFDNSSTKLLDEILQISGVNFKGVFEQPWFFCMQCYTDLLTAHSFRTKCLESHENPTACPKIDVARPLEETSTDPEKTSNETTDDAHRFTKISKICEVCGNVFQTKRNFALHLRRHTNNKLFECELCSNRFHTNAELKCHMRRHTGEKPYECSHCNRRFSDYGTHKKHVRTHTNERPFACNFCEKAFTSTFILKNHILTHTGKRAFECKICNKSFVHLGHLTSHLKSMFHFKNYKRAEGIEFEVNDTDE